MGFQEIPAGLRSAIRAGAKFKDPDALPVRGTDRAALFSPDDAAVGGDAKKRFFVVGADPRARAQIARRDRLTDPGPRRFFAFFKWAKAPPNGSHLRIAQNFRRRRLRAGFYKAEQTR